MKPDPKKDPDVTSAEGLERFVGGRPIRASHGEAWKEITAWFVEPPAKSEAVRLPSVSEPFLAWTMSGEVDFQEREVDGRWTTHRIRRGTFFLTFSGEPYDVRWEAVTDDPFRAMMVFIGLPLLNPAFDEVYGADASYARLRDASSFADEVLSFFIDRLGEELGREEASGLHVGGIAQAIAIHRARNYSLLSKERSTGSPSLPGHKLRQVTEWMAAHMADELNLDLLAGGADLSKYNFHRLFKHATGLSPSQCHRMLRMTEARRLLRFEQDRDKLRKIERDDPGPLGYLNANHHSSNEE